MSPLSCKLYQCAVPVKSALAEELWSSRQLKSLGYTEDLREKLLSLIAITKEN